ncbi:MAG: glycosyltransferase family 4 protein [Psychroserpens sp.]|uniref:glycosyltransferase family 4 protein n=1 Tax=Psychroserpens sp. TaxID=2020870 RepID=UPI0030039EF5
MNRRVLIVTSEFPPLPGGIGDHAYNLSKYLQLNDFQVDVITDQRDKDPEIEHSFDSILSFNVHRVNINQMRWIMYLKRIELLFKNIKSTDIIIASGKYSLWIVAFGSLFYTRKYVAVLHGTEVNFSNRVLRLLVNASLKRYSHLIAVSNHTKSLLKKRFLKNSVVIPNGFDMEKFDSNLSKTIELIGRPKLITVGNVTERKGQLNVIKHLPALINKYPDIHYHCVGLPTMAKAFIKVARELKVDQHITFHGRLKQEELQVHLNSCNIFVMLSAVTKEGDVEGFGIAILEANYLNIPAIGAINCGIEDAIDNYKSGILIDPTNTEAFLNGIDEILRNESMYSTAANHWACKHTWQIIIQRYINIIMS